jgi:transketolase
MLEQEIIKDCKQIREDILTMVYQSQSGHIGGSFSATELLLVLYKEFLRYEPKNPNWENRDYFVLSKGHASPVYYSILSYFHFFDKKELSLFRQINSPLQGHPDSKNISGVEVSTGSLGQGFGMAAGIALGIKQKKKQNAVVALLGDGELQEGNIWESAMACGHFALSNLLVIVDNNGLQLDGEIKDIMNVDPIHKKFEAFGFESLRIDGHNIKEIRNAYQYFYDTLKERQQPLVIVAKTVKGKGVSFMENSSTWHGKAPSKDQYEAALKELRS